MSRRYDSTMFPSNFEIAVTERRSSLYVGDLHPDVTQSDLANTFQIAGPLLSVRVCRDKYTGRSLCYGYVNFLFPCHAYVALNWFNHSVLRGKPMRVMWYDKELLTRNSGGNLFVKNLNKIVTDSDLQRIFSKYGNILSSKIARINDDGTSRGFGYVQFDSEDSAVAAIRALHNSPLAGQTLFVSKYLSRAERDRDGPTSEANRFVRAGNDGGTTSSTATSKKNALQDSLKSYSSAKIPGTQTFGCSHNQSDSEYMASQLSALGYSLSEDQDEADVQLINTCTVKNPSQSAISRSAKKPIVVAGCVPQGSRDLKELEGVSIVGFQQIDRVGEVVEETLKGHDVCLLTRKTLPALDLPKVRKNKFVEILPINVGCLGACTYCKTKHASGHLGSYTVDSLAGRVRSVVADGVKEIWLSSEDTGVYGRDIGVNLPILLNSLVAELPSDRSTMLRIGMTNPPYILEHLKEIAEVLRHPSVYSFLHVPVQSGSDSILTAMKREYTVAEFRKVVDTLIELVPGMQIATDIICGFPGETDEDFEDTINLIKDYKFSQVHISQFYPRPGTAEWMKKVPSNVVKKRSGELTALFESFTPYDGMVGNIERIWITNIATDGTHFVGHTKGYIQVLVVGQESMLGTSAMVKITSVERWSVFGEVIDILTENVASPVDRDDTSNLNESCCSKESETCACELTNSCGQTEAETVSVNGSQENNENEVLKLDARKEMPDGVRQWVILDKSALLFGTIVSTLVYLGSRNFSYK